MSLFSESVMTLASPDWQHWLILLCHFAAEMTWSALSAFSSVDRNLLSAQPYITHIYKQRRLISRTCRGRSNEKKIDKLGVKTGFFGLIGHVLGLKCDVWLTVFTLEQHIISRRPDLTRRHTGGGALGDGFYLSAEQITSCETTAASLRRQPKPLVMCVQGLLVCRFDWMWWFYVSSAVSHAHNSRSDNV